MWSMAFDPGPELYFQVCLNLQMARKMSECSMI